MGHVGVDMKKKKHKVSGPCPPQTPTLACLFENFIAPSSPVVRFWGPELSILIALSYLQLTESQHGWSIPFWCYYRTLRLFPLVSKGSEIHGAKAGGNLKDHVAWIHSSARLRSGEASEGMTSDGAGQNPHLQTHLCPRTSSLWWGTPHPMAAFITFVFL